LDLSSCSSRGWQESAEGRPYARSTLGKSQAEVGSSIVPSPNQVGELLRLITGIAETCCCSHRSLSSQGEIRIEILTVGQRSDIYANCRPRSGSNGDDPLRTGTLTLRAHLAPPLSREPRASPRVSPRGLPQRFCRGLVSSWSLTGLSFAYLWRFMHLALKCWSHPSELRAEGQHDGRAAMVLRYVRHSPQFESGRAYRGTDRGFQLLKQSRSTWQQRIVMVLISLG